MKDLLANVNRGASPSYWFKALLAFKEQQRTANPITSSLKHVDPPILEEWYYQYPFFRLIGLDLSKDTIRCTFSAHSSTGGVRINEDTETSLKSLYAAGEVTVNQSLPFSTFTGKLAGMNAARSAKEKTWSDLDTQEVNREEKRLRNLRRVSEGGIRPAQIKTAIRSVMSEGLHFVKSETSMKTAIEKLDSIESELVPRMTIASETNRFNYQWVDAIDVENMLIMSKALLRASIMRRESRNMFQRSDYPNRDDRNWLKWIVIKCVKGQMVLNTEEVEFPFLTPQPASS